MRLHSITRFIRYVPLVAWLIFTIIIFGYAFLASLSTTREIFTNKLLASGFHFSNYTRLFEETKIGLYFMNSLVYTVTSCVGIIVVAAPAAYIL